MSSQSFLLTIMLTLMLCISKAYIYDYLVLSIQWPPALCRAQPCTKYPATRFGVHGLWPNVYQGNDPSSCGGQFGVSFDPNVCYTPPLRNDLNNIWPNYLGRNIDFWRHEWDIHGSCVQEVFNQNDYFIHAVAVFNAADIYNLLTSEAGIKPDFNKNLNPTMFKNAIASKLDNATPQLACSGGINGLPIEIKEIRICLNHLGDQYINCPRPDSNCGTSTVK
ncbi:ribonuclease T2, partial [Trifolium pratense]